MTRNIYAQLLMDYAYDHRDENLSDRAQLEILLKNTAQPDRRTLERMQKDLTKWLDGHPPGDPPKMPKEMLRTPKSVWRKTAQGVWFITDWMAHGALVSFVLGMALAMVYFRVDHLEYARSEHPTFLTGTIIAIVLFAVLSLFATISDARDAYRKIEANYRAAMREHAEKERQYQYYETALAVLDDYLASLPAET